MTPSSADVHSDPKKRPSITDAYKQPAEIECERLRAENEALCGAILTAYNALAQVHVDHSRAHNAKHTNRARDVLRAELGPASDEEKAP
jgi:hypothetical protein